MDQNPNNNPNLKVNVQNNTGKSDAKMGGNRRPDKQKGSANIDGKQQHRSGKNSGSAPQSSTSKQSANVSSAGNNRFRHSSRNSGHGETSLKHSQVKRVETIDDIKADIERIDKEIQFEIKQIRSIRLGL